ncbi:MAG: glycine rich domain-containing protein [Clostridia bacterium]|nr:glycine rich domain-containing protein [Clostridia bacterium]MDD4375657.1 glycine rich domain-containing protein [Clostridia bacterium]
MESQLQKIIAWAVGILIFFMIPVYMAFEKIDDISYSLVLKQTQSFVDNVREKGYISPEMYNDYVMSMSSTGNFYDVQIEHVKKRYDPAIFIYGKGGAKDKQLLHILDYKKYTNINGDINNPVTLQEGNSVLGNKVQRIYDSSNSEISTGHTINKERITDKQIIDRLFLGSSITKEEYLRDCMMGNTSMYQSLRYLNENSYILNEGDQIIVSVKNTNQTIASVFYSLFTANVGLEEIPKVFVSYGGTIKNDGSTLVSEVNGAISSESGRMFKYKGEVEEVILEKGTYNIKCWGASGGGPTSILKGKGAYAYGQFTFSKDVTLYLYIGGQGTKYTDLNRENGGWNGGGNSYNGYGGGGATDVRLQKGLWDDTTSLLSRIIVAGGGRRK